MSIKTPTATYYFSQRQPRMKPPIRYLEAMAETSMCWPDALPQQVGT
jgi:hypothetical protein